MKTHKNTTIIIDEAGTKRLGKSKLSLKMIRLLRATKKCQACEEDKPLEPHRIIRGNKGGLYTVYKLDDKGSNVKMLCKDCHKKLHANENKHVSHSY